jgi:sugar phosphate isomerase/epimerase
MNVSRRSFVRHASLATAGVAFFSHPVFDEFKTKKLTGVQLYSVRDHMKTDPAGTLKQLAKMGYKNVEHASYANRKFYGYSVKEFKKLLEDLGLKMPSGHTVLQTKHYDEGTKDFTSEWKYTVEDAAEAGQQYVISPWLDESLRKDHDGLMRFLELFNRSGELCKKSGMKFGYHNHDFEFNTKVDGTLLYDIILQHTDPSLVIQQLDIGNMYPAGGRPLEVIAKYPGRFKSMHVKDELKDAAKNSYASTNLGKGVVNVKAVLDLAKKTGGTEHFIIEQEEYQNEDPMNAVKTDLSVMKKWGY